MENTEKLLKLLSDGRFHSGEALGSALGISRAAIWKQLQTLTALGLQVDSVRGKGYRLHRGVELLDQARIVAALEPGTNVAVHTCWQTTSTNDWVRSFPIRQNMTSKVACLAEYQSSGRGRRGRAAAYRKIKQDAHCSQVEIMSVPVLNSWKLVFEVYIMPG